MANLPIAVIGDSVSTHYANTTPPYFVNQSRIIGAAGPAASDFGGGRARGRFSDCVER